MAGAIFAVIYYVAKSKLFQGTGKFIFQGCISYIACILITYLGFAMLRFANMERKVARKLDGAAQKVSKKLCQLGSRDCSRSYVQVYIRLLQQSFAAEVGVALYRMLRSKQQV